jgi:transposase InsO family protein
MCALAQVSRAGYYRHWQACAPRQEETGLRDQVQRLSLANRHYGYRRIAALLRREGWLVNHKRVLRLMREDNLLCLRKRAFVPPTTDSRHSWRICPNLAWRLQPMAVNRLWVADITYVRLAEEFAYLAVVLDAYSRRVVGWALETHLQTTLALAALDMALGKRGRYPFSRASSAASRVRGRPIGRKRSERSALASSFVTKASEPQGRPLSAFRRSIFSSSLSSPSASQADQSATAERCSRHARSIVSTASAR